MPGITQCLPCGSPTILSTNIPGSDGNDGSAGLNGFSVVTADFNVPNVVGGTVTVAVDSSAWMVVGATVVSGNATDGVATFTVSAKPSGTSVTLAWLDGLGDVVGGTTLTSANGSLVSPGGFTAPAPLSIANGGTSATTKAAAQLALGLGQAPTPVYGSGTAYTLTTTPALLALGTTTPSLTIALSGTYLILARVRLDYTGATFAAHRTITLKLRDTSNNADIANSSMAIQTDIVTTQTITVWAGSLPAVVLTTTGATIEVWGSVNTGPTAGTLTAVEAMLIVIPLVLA